MTRTVQLTLGPVFDPLEDARRKVLEDAHKGVDCPVCGRHVEIRRRTLDTIKAWALVSLVDLAPRSATGWVHLRDITLPNGRDARTAGGEVARLTHWRMVEPKVDDDGRRAAGWYRPTGQGRAFACGKVDAPKWLDILDNRVVYTSPDLVDVFAALGTRFSLADVWETARAT